LVQIKGISNTKVSIEVINYLYDLIIKDKYYKDKLNITFSDYSIREILKYDEPTHISILDYKKEKEKKEKERKELEMKLKREKEKKEKEKEVISQNEKEKKELKALSFGLKERELPTLPGFDE
jgi:hypothetical protein